MGIGSFLRCTIAFFTGLYLGYQYHKAVNMYDQGLQKVRQPYFSVYNDDGHNNDDHNNDDQSDSSPSSSDNHSEPEFIGRNLTSPGRENSTESDDLESSGSSEEHSHSDRSLNSDRYSNSGYMRSFMSAINQIGPRQSTPQSSRAGSPYVVSDGPESPQTPIVVHDSDDTNVPYSSSIMATIRTVGSNIPLGVIMISRPDYNRSPSPSPIHSLSPSPSPIHSPDPSPDPSPIHSPIHSPDPSPGPSRPFSPDTGYNSNDNANKNKSDNESDGDTDPCERFNCFA